MRCGLQITLPFFLMVMFLPRASISEQLKFVDQDCMECHKTGFEMGFKVVPRVEPEEIEKSVHKEVNCVTCHTGIQVLPHEGMIERVDCQVCHEEEYTKYHDSVHGRSFEGEGKFDAPDCADCHGTHGILSHQDPESKVYRSEIPNTCAKCHENMQVVEKYNIKAESPYLEYSESVHGKALLRDGLINFAAVCTDCHGIHEIEGEDYREVSAHRPGTCGKCHITIFDVYKQSVHGRMYLEEDNRDVAVCVDCHGEHVILSPYDEISSVSPENIANTCAACHESEKMKKYDITSDKLKTYRESYHGIAQELGSLQVANCASCHGFHDIRPSSDPKSSIHIDNLPATCGTCHTRTSVNFAKGKVHLDIESKESGSLYYIRKIFIWVFAGLVLISIIWLFADLRKRFTEKRGD
jgi:nitrate/TMAO reductase-like tetraheme cytochrome c subunit